MDTIIDDVKVSFDLYVFPSSGPASVEAALRVLQAEEERLQSDEEGDLPVQTPEMASFLMEVERRWPSLEDDPDGSSWSSWPLWQPMADGGTALNIRWSQAETMLPAILRIAAATNVIVYDPQTEQIHQPDATSRRWRLFKRRRGSDT